MLEIWADPNRVKPGQAVRHLCDGQTRGVKTVIQGRVSIAHDSIEFRSLALPNALNVGWTTLASSATKRSSTTFSTVSIR
jgi:hypothetical protein